ncbi:hypothetical protein AWM70_22225 [Paenibacillus yonginensis]|uniref:Transglutaminase-like domain-containing protein n=1 Tax=Paenibacillus yonginensis TaxID=1462996 RepID=A0A1B1N6A8_9BACL|nr:transglutaminase domain-containing protein [Paenibacillus yonginensis]ANS76963.1 hypothetical protein AWM70_22225 [Paenibacillus yonginensis]
MRTFRHKAHQDKAHQFEAHQLEMLQHRASQEGDANRLSLLARIQVRLSSQWLAGFWASLLLYGLFLQWLEPLRILGGPDSRAYYTLLALLTAVILLIGCLGLPLWMTSVLALAALVQALVYLNGEGEGWSWLAGYAPVLLHDAAVWAGTGSMADISQASRVLVLLTGWILLVLSVQLLAIHRHTVLLFLSITVIYLFAFDLTAGLQLFWPVVWGFGLGLVLQFSVVYFKHAADRERQAIEGSGSGLARYADPDDADLDKPGQLFSQQRRPASYRVLMGLGGFIVAFGIGLSLAAAFVVPVKPAQAVDWGQAFDSMETWAEPKDGRGSGYSVTGYGGNDEELGSPLKLREDVFFTAESPQRTYWRGESLSYYDGRGWTEPDPSISPSLSANASGVAAWPAEEAADGDMQDGAASRPDRTAIQTITFAEPQYGMVPLFAGGDFLAVRQVNTELTAASPVHPAAGPAYTLLKDPVSGSAYLKMSTASDAIRSYKISAVLKPETSSGAPAADSNATGKAGADPSEIRYEYLQLPATLPDRVRDLGQSIVSGATSRYEAAKAVETYLRNNYKYTLNTSIPAAGHDFVEDFLFRERAGYCDHFSTAMVILLRSQGIPARWVKGFAPGEPDGSGQYTVRYADAHSWVEVYFPDQGWLPFEPTPGFTGAFGGAAEGSIHAEQGQQPVGSPALSRVLGAWLPNVTAVFAAALIKVWPLAERTGDMFNHYQTVIVAAAALLLLAFVFLGMGRSLAGNGGLVRRKPRSRPHSQVFFKRGTLTDERHFPGKVELLRSADAAWAAMHRRYGKLANGATAREYAEALQRKLDESGRAEMEQFMSVWEPLYYGGDLPDRQTTRRFLDTCRKLDS